MNQLTKDVRYRKWAEIILAANNSGLSKTEFCKQNGISKRTLYYYQNKIRQGLYDNVMQEEAIPLVEVPLSGRQSSSSDRAAIIHFGDITIEISDGISESTLMSIGRMIRNAL